MMYSVVESVSSPPAIESSHLLGSLRSRTRSRWGAQDDFGDSGESPAARLLLFMQQLGELSMEILCGESGVGGLEGRCSVLGALCPRMPSCELSFPQHAIRWLGLGSGHGGQRFSA